MSEKNNGGPAFPHPEPRDPQFSVVAPGMSLRDWFAGQALAGLITINEARSAEDHATVAFMLADAMLATREGEMSDGDNPPEVQALVEALLDATAHLSGAASAYRKYARRYTGLKPNGETDPFFLTRVEDFEKASLRARAAIEAWENRNG